MKKRQAITFLAFAMTIFFLTSCAGGGANTQASTTSNPPAATTTVAAVETTAATTATAVETTTAAATTTAATTAATKAATTTTTTKNDSGKADGTTENAGMSGVPDLSGLVRADYHDYSQYPLSDGSAKVRIAVPRDDTYGVEAEDKWWWVWIQQVTGIDFEIESILSSAVDERKNLMFASGDLPDVIWGIYLKANEIVLYGQSEGVLMPFNDYINADVMPYLTELLAYEPALNALITCLDGKIYTLPGIREKLHGDSTRTFINKNFLDQCGLDVPTTLDEFITAMYKFKELDSNILPIGGCYSGGKNTSGFDMTYYILNAVGYLGNGYNDGTKVTIRNNEAVIPAADETFIEVLKIMNQFYKDGIISPDYYTIDNTTVNAQMAEGKLGVYPYVPFTVNIDPDFYDDYVSVTPLTSAWNETRQWKSPNRYNAGGWTMSAKSQYGEMMCRFVDFLYTPLGINLSWMGPPTDSDYTLGMTNGWYQDPNTGSDRFPDVDNGVYQNSSDYVNKVSSTILSAVGNYGDWPPMPGLSLSQYRALIQGSPMFPDEFDLAQPDPYFRASMYKYISPYEREGYPNTVYMAEDDVYAMEDLESVLVPYMQSEIAKFITGARDLSEYNIYLGELRSMNVDQYVKYYKDNYANYLAQSAN